ncbi:hypothetical protein BH10BAC2_BH10BAC2_11660 [soil metagenome]
MVPGFSFYGTAGCVAHLYVKNIKHRLLNGTMRQFNRIVLCERRCLTLNILPQVPVIIFSFPIHQYCTHMEKIKQRKPPVSFINAVILTGLTAGTLDIIGAIINFMANGGKDPLVIFKYIGSAVFGKTAFDGSASMIIAGLGFHYLIAFVFTMFFFLIYPKVKLLSANSFIVAIFYGIFVWAAMNLIVLPLTKLSPIPFDMSKAGIAAVILIICIGWPVVTGAKKYYRNT